MNLLNVNMNVVYTIINLLILALLFKRFLFKPVDKILEERMRIIDMERDEATEARSNAEMMKHEYEARLKAHNDQVDSIISDAKEKAYEQYNEIISHANKEAEDIIDAAKSHAKVDAEREKNRILSDLSNVVVDAASKIAATAHTPETDSDLYDRFIKESMESRKSRRK